MAFLALLTWVILGSPSWSFLSFSSNGLDTDCLVKRLLDLMLGLVVLFHFLLFLCQRELKYDMGANFLVAQFVRLVSYLVGLGRFLPCNLGTHLSRLRHVGWNQCSHGLDSRPLESCHHQCLKALCGVLGYLELLDGTLKLRHCTDLFTKRFPPLWSLPRVGSGIGKRYGITPGHSSDTGGNSGQRVRLTKKTRPGSSFSCHSGPRSRALNAEEMEKIAPPFLRRRGGRGGRASQSFSSPWGWVILHLGTPGTCTRRLQAWLGTGWTVQPKGPAHWRRSI